MKASRKKLDLIMAKQELTQDMIGEKLNMNRGTLSTIFNGRNAQPITIGRIANALGVPVQDILEEEGE